MSAEGGDAAITIPLTVLIDGLPDQALLCALICALDGQRPSQPDREADYYVEGAITRGALRVRICLALADMSDHVVMAAYRRDFPTTMSNARIAQAAADALGMMAVDQSANGGWR